MPRRYWLMKSEPSVFSWSDLLTCPNSTTPWEGVRNYQARNYMRDDMQVGDGILFYHSSSDPTAIVGIARVASRAYPDPSAFDQHSKYYDARSKMDNPQWLLVDVTAVETLPRPLTLDQLRHLPGLDSMVLLKKGSRLSVQPVSIDEWRVVLEAAGIHHPI